MQQTVLLLIIALWAFPASGQVYRHVDENGNVSFTDQPPPNAEPVEIRTPNTSAPPPVLPRVAPPPTGNPVPSASYDVSITTPADQTIIPNGPGNFSVSVTVSPSLESDHRLQLKLNGTPRGEPQSASSWALTNVFRGEQRISVAVIDDAGEQLVVSDEVTVFVFRPSVNN